MKNMEQGPVTQRRALFAGSAILATLFSSQGQAQSLQPLTGIYQVTTYGAVGNGSSNPASTKYGTLAALQAVYGTTVGGVTIALTNELDWLGIQKAIDVVHAAYGGTVYIPPPVSGNYVLSNSSSAADGSGTIMLYVTSTGPQQTGPSCDLEGAFEFDTILSWPSDLGSGRAALSCGPSNATYTSGTGRYGYNFYEGWIRNLIFSGPNGGNAPTPGVAPANMHGLMLGARRHCMSVQSQGFNHAFDHCGDYTEFHQCYGILSYYGYYSADANAALYGGHRMVRCMFNGNAMAAIAVSKNGSFNVTAQDCYLGFNPYAFLFEAGTPASYGQPAPSSALYGSHFLHCSAEYITNQFMLDDNATVSGGGNTGTMTRGVVDCVFEDLIAFNGGTVLTTGGRNAYAHINMDFAYYLKLPQLQGSSFLPAASGMLAMVLINDLGQTDGGGMSIEGNVDPILAAYGTAAIPVLLCATGQYGPIGIFGDGGHVCFRWIKLGEWEGNPEYVAGTSAIPIGAVVERVNYNSVQLGGTASAGSTLIAGINKYAVGANKAGILTVVATKASVTSVNVTASIANASIVKLGTGGNVVLASSATDGQTVGWVRNYNGGSTSSIKIALAFLGSN